MSYQEKNNLLSLFVTLAVTLPYYVYVFTKYQAESFTTTEAFKYWAAALLILIPVRIVIEIIIHIASAILEAIITKKENPAMITDERDNLIELKAIRNSYFTFVMGFVTGLILLYTTDKPEYLFIAMIAGGFCAEMAEHFSKIYYYQRGS